MSEKLPEGVINVVPRDTRPYQAVRYRVPEDNKAVLDLFSQYVSFFGDGAVVIYDNMLELCVFYDADRCPYHESVCPGDVIIVRPAIEGLDDEPEVRITDEDTFNKLFKEVD